MSGIGQGQASVAGRRAHVSIVLTTLGDSGSFCTFAILGVVAWVFVFFMVPETKGRTLEEI